MAINKVKYGNTTLIDLTDMTAIASDVASGKTFYGKDGVKTTGIATGSGGCVYETGTYTTNTDVATASISFSKTHTEPPIYVSIYDVTQELNVATNSNMGMTVIDVYRLFGAGYQYNTTAYRYGTVQYIYKGSSSLNTGTVHFTYNSDTALPSNPSTSYARYWITETGFKGYSNSATRYWRAGRTYKWVAIWKW